MISSIFWIVPISALCALLFAWIFYKGMKVQEEGTDKMKEIAEYVREGAMAYLKSQYTVVGKIFIILVVLLSILAYMGVQNPFVPVAFLTGGIFSGLCGYLGMKTATFASNRTAWAASKSLNKGLQVALRSGAVMGLVVVGFALLDIAAGVKDVTVYWADNQRPFRPARAGVGAQADLVGHICGAERREGFRRLSRGIGRTNKLQGTLSGAIRWT